MEAESTLLLRTQKRKEDSVQAYGMKAPLDLYQGHTKNPSNSSSQKHQPCISGEYVGLVFMAGLPGVALVLSVIPKVDPKLHNTRPSSFFTPMALGHGS